MSKNNWTEWVGPSKQMTKSAHENKLFSTEALNCLRSRGTAGHTLSTWNTLFLVGCHPHDVSVGHWVCASIMCVWECIQPDRRTKDTVDLQPTNISMLCKAQSLLFDRLQLVDSCLCSLHVLAHQRITQPSSRACGCTAHGLIQQSSWSLQNIDFLPPQTTRKEPTWVTSQMARAQPFCRTWKSNYCQHLCANCVHDAKNHMLEISMRYFISSQLSHMQWKET